MSDEKKDNQENIELPNTDLSSSEPQQEEESLLELFGEKELKRLIKIATPNSREAEKVEIENITEDQLAEFIRVADLKISHWGNPPKKKYDNSYKKRRRMRNRMARNSRRINRKTNKLYKPKTVKN